jgi:hypothetical protein
MYGDMPDFDTINLELFSLSLMLLDSIKFTDDSKS